MKLSAMASAAHPTGERRCIDGSGARAPARESTAFETTEGDPRYSKMGASDSPRRRSLRKRRPIKDLPREAACFARRCERLPPRHPPSPRTWRYFVRMVDFGDDDERWTPDEIES